VNVIDRFDAKCEPDSKGCLIWTGYVHVGGYGSFSYEGRVRRAHRVAYELFYETEVPEGLELDHICHVSRCVNPLHLEAVTHLENMRRAKPANKTHCAQGHPYTAENTLIKNTGRRNCRACRDIYMREYNRRYYARERAA
jgi:hypothetical protein